MLGLCGGAAGAAHIAADGNGGEAVGKGQVGGISGKLAGGGAVGFGVADQTTDGTLAADAVPVLLSVLTVVALGQLGGVEGSVIAVDINAAAGDQSVVARGTHQGAGGRVAVNGLGAVSGTTPAGTGLDLLGLVDKGIALNGGVDHVQVGDGGVHIAEQACEAEVHIAHIVAGGVGLGLILGGVDIDVIDALAAVHAQDLGMIFRVGDALGGAGGVGPAGHGIDPGVGFVGKGGDAAGGTVQQRIQNGVQEVFQIGNGRSEVNELGGAEQRRVMNGYEVGKVAHRRVAGSAAEAAAVKVHGLVPVDVVGEEDRIHFFCHGRGDGVQILQVPAVGDRKNIPAGIGGAFDEIVEHGVDAVFGIG